VAPRTPPLAPGFDFVLACAPRAPPEPFEPFEPLECWAPAAAAVEVDPVVDVVECVVVDVEPVVVVVSCVVVDVEPVVDVDPVVVVVPCVVVEVEPVVVVVVLVVPPVTHMLASLRLSPGYDGPRKMSPACFEWPLIQPLMLIEITTYGFFAEPVL
jgi:hypothetical protein